MSRKTAGIPRPVKELKGFEKVLLAPGETKTVKFTLCKRAFAYYNTDISDWYVEDGVYGIMVGASSRDIRLEGEVKVSPVKPYIRPFDLNASLGEMMAIPAVAAKIAPMLQAFAPPPAEDDDEGMMGMGVSASEMMAGIPLRAMIGFSGGAFSEEMALGLLAMINAELK